jgi:hypothetical protein
MNFDHALSENNSSTDAAAESATPIEASAHTPASEAPVAQTDVVAPNKTTTPTETAAEPKPVAAEEKTVPPSVEAAAPSTAKSEPAPQESKPAPRIEAPVDRSRSSLIPFVAPERADAPPPPKGADFMRAAFEKRFQIGAVAASLALVSVLAAASISYKSQQDQYLVTQSQETESLAETVKTLKAKIAALEAAKRDEIGDLRKTVADLKNGVAAARDAGSSTAQLSARYDRVEHEQDARIEKLGERVDHDAATHYADLTSRLEKLSERIDHEATAHNADFTSRLEKLEKKAAAPVVAAITPAQAAPTPPVAQKAPTPPTPPVAPGVSKETTGSIPAPRPPIRNWIVREVHGGMAVVEGPYGYRQIGPGDTLPGAGRVERIERNGRDWSVVTSQGTISSASARGAMGGGMGPMGPGGMGPGGMNGMVDGEF